MESDTELELSDEEETKQLLVGRKRPPRRVLDAQDHGIQPRRKKKPESLKEGIEVVELADTSTSESSSDIQVIKTRQTNVWKNKGVRSKNRFGIHPSLLYPPIRKRKRKKKKLRKVRMTPEQIRETFFTERELLKSSADVDRHLDHIVFIDLDNDAKIFDWFPQLHGNTIVYVFYGGNTYIDRAVRRDSKLYLHLQATHGVEFFKCCRAKDSADFNLVVTLGGLNEKLNKGIPFAIISGDNGFTSILKRLQGRKVKVFNPHELRYRSPSQIRKMINQPIYGNPKNPVCL